MAVLKNKTQGRYVNVFKDILEDKSLKLVDRGMLVTLLSLPDNWDFSIRGMSTILPDGKSTIQKSLNRLEDCGYITREQERGSNGKFGDNNVEVHETPILPCAEKPCTEKTYTEKPYPDMRYPENQPQLNNNILSNNQLSKKEDVYMDELSDSSFITLLLANNEDYPITQKECNEYIQLYPDLDVKQELCNMKAWCLANPTKRKTSAGINRFVVNWLNRSNEKKMQYHGNNEPKKEASPYAAICSQIEQERRG